MWQMWRTLAAASLFWPVLFSLCKSVLGVVSAAGFS